MDNIKCISTLMSVWDKSFMFDKKKDFQTKRAPKFPTLNLLMMLQYVDILQTINSLLKVFDFSSFDHS